MSRDQLHDASLTSFPLKLSLNFNACYEWKRNSYV